MIRIMALIAIIFSHSGWGTIVAGVRECPTQFEGRVKEIIHPLGPSDIFSVDRVIFENNRTLRGDVSDTVSLEILQNGPFQMEVDHNYKVQHRNGKICWIEEI